jgi:isopentenyl diphosphate isomerase/L-lactate dehydrogenase-like FMN-dependent dehydrogenase
MNSEKITLEAVEQAFKAMARSYSAFYNKQYAEDIYNRFKDIDLIVFRAGMKSIYDNEYIKTMPTMAQVKAAITAARLSQKSTISRPQTQGSDFLPRDEVAKRIREWINAFSEKVTVPEK